MAWDDTVASGDTIGMSEWNNMVTALKSHDNTWHSTNYEDDGAVATHESTYNHTQYNTAYTHSQTSTGNPHSISYTDLDGSPSDDITAGTNLSWDGNTLNSTGGGTGFTPHVYPDSEDISVDGSDKIYFSGQGTTYVYSGTNTLIISSQVGSAGNLSDLTINADKDWNSKGISNLTYLSSQTVSGGTIKGEWIVPLYSSKPAATDADRGKIIRVSGGTDEGTWVFMCVENSSNDAEWIQLGVST